MKYAIEAARLLLPGLGTGFLISSAVQGFAQPWWSIGLVCFALGVLMNVVPGMKRNEEAYNKVMKVLQRYMPWIALVLVVITIIVSIFR